MQIIENGTKRVEQGSVNKFLASKGFTAKEGVRKLAGVSEAWMHQDGRTASVSYGLVGRVGQSAGSAGWAHTVRMGR